MERALGLSTNCIDFVRRCDSKRSTAPCRRPGARSERVRRNRPQAVGLGQGSRLKSTGRPLNRAHTKPRPDLRCGCNFLLRVTRGCADPSSRSIQSDNSRCPTGQPVRSTRTGQTPLTWSCDDPSPLSAVKNQELSPPSPGALAHARGSVSRPSPLAPRHSRLTTRSNAITRRSRRLRYQRASTPTFTPCRIRPPPLWISVPLVAAPKLKSS
jgi:hypothetical protein